MSDRSQIREVFHRVLATPVVGRSNVPSEPVVLHTRADVQNWEDIRRDRERSLDAEASRLQQYALLSSANSNPYGFIDPDVAHAVAELTPIVSRAGSHTVDTRQEPEVIRQGYTEAVSRLQGDALDSVNSGDARWSQSSDTMFNQLAQVIARLRERVAR